MQSAADNVLILLDSSYRPHNAIEAAITQLAGTPQDQITIISVVTSAAAQKASVHEITASLQSLRHSFHPSTRFNIFAIADGVPQLENTVHKLILKLRPQLMLLGLSTIYSATVFSHLQRTQSAINVVHMDEFESIVPDEDEDWCIRGSPRCMSPVDMD
ncbi:hypothetical protein HDU79_000013 [Rhizoclosmatium sp. JEL0117]|nr:hypothetical protein HDU79_000013 [Rhizoclosmatium sp. JEL0117]